MNWSGSFQNKNTDFPLSPEQVLLLGFFFFNILFLPHGLLYTTLLTPFFLIDLIIKRKLRLVLIYVVSSGLLSLYYWYSGVDRMTYLKSYILFSSVFIFVAWVYFFLRKNHWKLGQYFNTIVPFNFLFTLLALVFLIIPGMDTIMWHLDPIHPAIPAIPRLKLLVYEPSFYSLMLAPLFLYYLLAYLFNGRGYLPGLIMVSFSLALSLSFGVIGGLILALLILFVVHFSSLLKHPRPMLFFISTAIMAVVAYFLISQFFPDNPIIIRMEKVMEGDDTSANGRTWEAFLMAWKILEETSYLLGAGLGQIKVAGHDIIVGYYNYFGEWANTVRIPNAMGETLATFGIIGVVVRLFTEVGLFFYTRTYNNYYRFTLFAFIFIYQFTGSYLTNIYEYLIWVLVFLPIFPQFDRQSLQKVSKQS